MKTAIPVMLAVVLASAASAQPKAANNPQDLVNMEMAWSKAAVARDAAALSRIVAPDWTGQNHRGKMYNRAAMIHETTAGEEKLTSMVNHDVHVRFIGNDHAIVQGMDNESGVTKGKTVKEVYSWTDVYEKRGGHWVAIASQNTPVK
ncbi:MAG: nuclear transport factor 2 family protein [Sphingomicrobium sp.]